MNQNNIEKLASIKICMIVVLSGINISMFAANPPPITSKETLSSSPISAGSLSAYAINDN